MYIRFIKTLFLIIFSASLHSQGQVSNPYYNFKHLNTQNGLIQNVVYHFLQDSKGYLWIGTRNGITLYDGIRTINFQHAEQNKKSLSGNFITCILEDRNHIIWIGTDEGIDQFDQSTNSFIHYEILMADGHKENAHCILLGFAGRDDLWFIDAVSKSIKIFNTLTKQFRFIHSSDAVDGICVDDSLTGTVKIWTYLSISTTEFVFKHDSLISQINYFNGNKKNSQPSLLIFHVCIQNDSTVWLATAKGLIELNPKTNKYIIYDKLNSETVNEIRYVAIAPGGLLWAGTGNNGIFTFDPRTGKFINHFRNEPLDPFSICSNNMVSLYFDHVGNIWCGSYGNGLSYAHVENNFFSKHISKTETDHWKDENDISWIGADLKGNLWCIIQDVQGFWLLDSTLRIKSFRLPLLENGKPFVGSVYEILFSGKETAWCTTDRGLFQYNISTNRFHQVKYHLLSNALFGSKWSTIIVRLHDSSILFSTFGGVYRISGIGDKKTILPFSEINHRPSISTDLIYEDNNHNLYIKDRGDSLYILVPSDTKGNYFLKQTLTFHPDILQFREAGSALFLATNAGLFILDKNNLTITKSAINALLPFTSINDVWIQGNTIWLFGDKGLYAFNEQEKTGRLFTTEDGLPSNNFKEYSFLIDSSGKCIVGTSNGIMAFYPEKLVDHVYPPRAQLINMYVNDSTKGFIANPQETSKVVLEHDQNTFSFDYSCISFQHAQTSVYEYKLDGYDESWIRGGTTDYTRYSRIAPGNYRFNIRTRDPKGVISPYLKTLDIEIKKAFWQTTLFRALLTLFFGFITWLGIKWYLNMRIGKQQVEFEKKQAIEKERTRIATDMHDDLGAGLSRIKFLSETIAMKKQIQQPIEEDISSISNYANEMIGKMGEIVWALNEKNDSLSDLLSYTRAYATEYLMVSGIHCHVEAPLEFPSVFVSGEFRRNIYLTIKEALHNIFKHARAEHVSLIFRIDRNLTISLQDDGVGFDGKNIRPFSNGLVSMDKRMKEIGGSLQVVLKKGVLIILTAPLPE